MIVDVFAAIALVAGAALAALGGFGLLRFPDVFTRMHAATKVASVGVIATTAAAAAEAGALSGVLVLLLVIALLFITAPVGMSLLARAAYHDPETPRVANTSELDLTQPGVEPMNPVRATGTSRLLVVWLFLVWIALFGSLRGNVIVGGVVASGTIAYVMRRVAPRWPSALLHPMGVLRFAGHFSVQLLTSTWDVIRLLLRREDELRPAVVEVPLRVGSRYEIGLLMNAITFTPGTVALEVVNRRLYVHMMSPRSPEAIVAAIDDLQRLIHEAFGSDRADAT